MKFLTCVALDSKPVTERAAILPRWEDELASSRKFGPFAGFLAGVMASASIPLLPFSGLVAIQRAHRLVTNGPYKMVHHPSYLRLLVSSLGWALVFGSGVGVVLMC